MNYEFPGIYAALGESGVQPYLTMVENLRTYKLVTGVDAFDPYRGAGPGRAFDTGIFHIYTADQIQVCSGEALGNRPAPQKAIVGEYLISGTFLDYDGIRVPGFQDVWGACSGERRHDFSQQFTSFLLQQGCIPTGAIGATWTSFSGKLLGIGGRVYAVTVTGEPHVVYQCSYDYPRTT